MDNKKPQQKKKKSPVAGIVVGVILLSWISEAVDSLGDGELLYRMSMGLQRLMRPLLRWLFRHGVDPDLLEIVPWLVLVLVVVLLIALIKFAVKRKRAAAEDKPPMPKKRRPDPRTASFTEPEAHCVSCELSGDDHFARDRAQRIAQLDEWLKAGLIEKDEYHMLKRRYQG